MRIVNKKLHLSVHEYQEYKSLLFQYEWKLETIKETNKLGGEAVISFASDEDLTYLRLRLGL